MSDLLGRASEVFLETCDLAPAEQRAQLERLRAEDPKLHAEVEFLLKGDRSARSNLDAPAYQSFAKDLSALDSQHLPEHIGRYRVVRKIGEGGMGIVFEAEQEAPARRVALKLMRPLFGGDSMQRRFEYEVAVLGRLQHPGIAQIIEAGICDLGAGAQPFFAMEYVDGERLGVWARRQELEPRARLELLVKLCEAAHHAHQKGLIHRDLKPDNILVTGDGQPKILDFGIARAVADEAAGPTMHTQAGQVVGTLGYMSPEQVRGRHDELEISSDVYSLGVIGFEVLCGEMPYDLRGRPITESVRIITEQDPPPLGDLARAYRGDVETIVAKAMEKEKSQRYQSAAEFGADIQRFLDDVPIVARPHTVFYELKRFARRNRALVGGSLATLIAIIGGAIGTLVFALRAGDQEQLAKLNAYSLGVRAASNAVDDSKYRSARTFLDETPLQFRGWEWHYVDSLLQPWERELTADVPVVEPICYTPDGTRLVSALADGTIGVWDLSTGELSRPLRVDAKISAIANNFPADGLRLAAGAEDGRVLVWDLSAPEAPLVLRGHDQRISALTWMPDGGLLTADPVSARLWRGDRSVKTFSVLVPASAMARGAELVAAPDGREFAHAWNLRICSTNLDTGKTRTIVTVSNPLCVAYSPTEEHLVVGTLHQNLHILDATTLERLDDDHSHTRPTDRLRYSPDGSVLAAASADGTLTLRDAETRRTLAVYACGRAIRGLAFRPDGRQIACGDLEGSKVTLWNLPMDAATVFGDMRGNVHSLGWSPDGTLLLAGTTPPHVTRVLDPLTGEVLLELEDCAPRAFDLSSQRLLVRRGAGRYLAIDLASGVEEHLPGDWKTAHAGFARRYGIHPGRHHKQPCVDPSATFVHEPGLRPRVVRLSNGEVLTELPHRHPASHATAFSPDGRRLFSTFGERGLGIYDVATWRKIGELPAGVHTRSVMGADFSADGRRIVTACHDNLVRVFDAETYKLVLELEGHRSHVACAVFSPDGGRIASSGGDATVRIWDSIPRAARSSEARAAAALRKGVAPRIESWFAERDDATGVAARLRSDQSLTTAQRAAGLKVLMARRR